VLVSPARAKEDLAAATYPWQRPLRPYIVQFQLNLIQQGHLRNGTIISFAVFRKTGQRYCVNGQHTLKALSEYQGRAILLQYEEHEVDTEEEVSRLYQSYDMNLTRSWKDRIRADSALRDKEIPPKALEKLSGVTQLLANGFAQQFRFGGRPWDPLLKDTIIRVNLMENWLPELNDFLAGLKGARSNIHDKLYRASVFAVALVTYRWQPTVAHQFWPRLAHNSGLERGEPEWLLMQYLQEHTTRVVEPTLYQRTVASAWNHYFNQKNIVTFTGRVGAAREPICLDGTPHDGKAHYSYLRPDGLVIRQPRALDQQ